jgi:hypothetical protein
MMVALREFFNRSLERGLEGQRGNVLEQEVLSSIMSFHPCLSQTDLGLFPEHSDDTRCLGLALLQRPAVY